MEPLKLDVVRACICFTLAQWEMATEEGFERRALLAGIPGASRWPF